MSEAGLIEPAEAALAVLEELKRQRTEGIRELYMEDSTLESLEDLLGGSEKVPPVPQRQVVSQVAEPVHDTVASVVEEPTSTAPLPKASFAFAPNAPKLIPAIVIGISR